MKRILGTVSVLACAFSLNTLVAFAGDHDHAHAEVGKPAPAFELKDVDGKTHKLSDLKGKIVVLEWTNFKCPFVVRHQKDNQTMQKTLAKFKDKDVVWLAVDSTNPEFDGGHTNEMIKEWAESEGVKLPYPVLRDEKGEIGHQYGAQTTPHMYVIDKNGILAYSGAIDDDPKGEKENPTNFVEQAVNSLLADSTVEVAFHKPYGCSVKYKK